MLVVARMEAAFNKDVCGPPLHLLLKKNTSTDVLIVIGAWINEFEFVESFVTNPDKGDVAETVGNNSADTFLQLLF